MCGFVGFASNQKQFECEWILRGNEKIINRGPDASGVWFSKNKNIGLAHRRLSILDLSKLANQPMFDQQKNICIVYNGEIYNYKFLRNELEKKGEIFYTESDTEVIILGYKVWGTEVLKKLHGMFSFAIFDKKENIVFLSRDRAGEKPLFYHHKNGVLSFASELKSLLTNTNIEKKIDLNSLDYYLSTGMVTGDMCLVKDCKKLKPGHALIFNIESDKVKIVKYWEIPNFEKNDSYNEKDLIYDFNVLLQKSVDLQLVADVDVGILLSGGVDSSIITALAANNKSKIKTFNIGFPQYKNYDETAHAKLIADHFGTDHTELMIDKIDPNLIVSIARDLDEPMVDSSIFPTFLVSKLVRQNCKVALGGDGGDELFGGYMHYSRLIWLKNRINWIPASLRRLFIKNLINFLPIGFKGKNWIRSLGYDFKNTLPQLTCHYDIFERKNLLKEIDNYQFIAESLRLKHLSNEKNLLQRATRTDFNNYLPYDILTKVDRASMMNSLELRAPFLDVDVIEFALRKVPSELKANMYERKIFLKKIARKLLPDKFDFNRKQGFSIPLRDWLIDSPLRKVFEEILFDESSVFNRNTIESIFKGLDKGRRNEERLYSLFLFEVWRNENSIKIS